MLVERASVSASSRRMQGIFTKLSSDPMPSLRQSHFVASSRRCAWAAPKAITVFVDVFGAVQVKASYALLPLLTVPLDTEGSSFAKANKSPP